MYVMSVPAQRGRQTRSIMLPLTEELGLSNQLRKQYGFIVESPCQEVPDGFACYLVKPGGSLGSDVNSGFVINVSSELAHLTQGDIVKVTPDGGVRIMYRGKWRHNSILLTERCNNYCLMCSQPPKRGDDSWLLEDAEMLVRLMPVSATSLGLTGGEPTLYGERLVHLLKLCKNWLPNTSLHLLSNGRAFSDFNYAQQYASVNHHDLMVGVPLYSDDPAVHDYVVQASGAFDETVRGILNLKRLHQKVEIRVVLHRQTISSLVGLAEFISRNLLFVDQVVLMGLELTGFARANREILWVDPVAYKDDLSKAVQILKDYQIPVMVYNHQLCLVNPDVYSVCVKSISEWKNDYATECEGCAKLGECGGFFSSGIQHGYSESIKPFRDS